MTSVQDPQKRTLKRHLKSPKLPKLRVPETSRLHASLYKTLLELDLGADLQTRRAKDGAIR
jgi:hypothetical protein